MAEIRVERTPKRGLGWLWALLLVLLLAAAAWYVWSNHAGTQPGTTAPDTTRVGVETGRAPAPVVRALLRQGSLAA